MNSWTKPFIRADHNGKGDKTKGRPQEGKQYSKCILIIITSVIPESDFANSCMNGMGSSTWIASAFSISACEENNKPRLTSNGKQNSFPFHEQKKKKEKKKMTGSGSSLI